MQLFVDVEPGIRPVITNMRVTAQKSRYGVGGLLLVVAALIYLFTLDTGLRPEELVGGDLITHQYAQVEARPSNAPGYPLYTMGGWFWFRLGKSALAWALNPVQILSLYSTLWSLASLLVLYLILLKVTRRQWLIAFLLTLFYGFTFFFWYYSVTTEQYTSAVFQTLLVIWLAFKWDEQSRPALRILLWLAFVTGTMLANMVTTLFILPPLLWFILFKRDKLPAGSSAPAGSGTGQYFLVKVLKQPRVVFQVAGLAFLPMLSYVYVYIRGAQHPEWRGEGSWETPWQWFVQFLTIRQGRDELAPGLTVTNFFTAEFPALMWHELTWFVFLGGLVGLAFLGRRRAVFLLSTVLLYFFFSWGYRFGNWFQVIIPAYPIFVIGFAAAVRRLAGWQVGNWGLGAKRGDWAQSVGMRRWVFGREVLVVLFLTGLVIYRFATNLPEANQRYQPEDTGLVPGRLILADRPQTPAVITCTFEERVALQYLETIWGAISDIYPTGVGYFEPGPTVDLEAVRVYLTRRAAMMKPDVIRLEEVSPQAAGIHLIALEAEAPSALPATATPLAVNFGHQLQLVGWEQLTTGPVSPPDLPRPHWQVALYWQALTPLTADYTVSVRPLVGGSFITAGGEPFIQDHQPVWGLYPTSQWRPGELVRDVYALSWPDGTITPDAVQIVVYRPTDGGFENLAERTIPWPPAP